MNTNGDNWGLSVGELHVVPKTVNVRVRKLVIRPVTPPSGKARSVPSEVGSTAGHSPVVLSRPKEHPQPLSLTIGEFGHGTGE